MHRFWSKVRPEGDCLIWTGARNYGYGIFQRQLSSGTIAAHRFIYAKLAQIPKGYHIDHLCRNRACVNFKHLEAVTQAENLRRGEGPTGTNLRKTHCIHGHEYTPENTYRRPGKAARECLTCLHTRSLARASRKSA